MNPNDKSKKGIKDLNNNNRTLYYAFGRLFKSILSVAWEKIYYFNWFELMWAKCEQLNPKAIILTSFKLNTPFRKSCFGFEK